ncbi:hemagglutinin repeat-containing protein, partial [Serratia aquatilis]
NTQQSSGKNSSSGFGVGVDVSTAGVMASVNANKGQGSENGNGTQWTETTVDSGNKVNITSGRDTTLSGAQVSGDSVKMDVGRDLTLSSQQDSDRFDAKQTSVSGGLSVPIGTGVGGAQFSTSRDKLQSNYDSVQEQTGVFAGQGGFDITVGNHTQLDGAVIASTAPAEKNTLDTGTLGFSNIENKAEFKAEHQGGSFSTGGSLLGDVLSNSNNLSLAGANNSGHAEGTTQAAVSDGTIIIRDPANQKQDVNDLSCDTENANGSIAPIFDKEKEQNRLKQAQLIGEIGGQAMDILRTQGDINGLEAALKANPKLKGDEKALRDTPEYQAAMQKYGTGSDVQKAAQAVTAALQGLAGGNMAAAIAGGLSPYAVEQIKAYTKGNDTANVLAHAVWGAIAAEMSGNSAAAGAAGGELAARYLVSQLYPGVKPEDLTEEQKQNISALSTPAAGLAGGVTGDSSANALAGAQAGKNATENNFLRATSSNKLDKAVEKIMQGDKSLAAANDLLTLANADKRSDALVSKFTKDPSQMSSTERAELAGYLRVYASEMEKTYGSAVAQELVKGMLSGRDYIKRNPDSEAMAKAQVIMNTWGYHKSNASIGDSALIFGSSVLGTTIKGMAANAAIGVGVNAGVQLSGKDPFSYVDAIMAGVTAAATTGKGIVASTPINMGGAAIGSSIKGEDPANSAIAAGVGSVLGGAAGKIATEQLKPAIKEGSAEIIGAVTGGTVGEITGKNVQDSLNNVGDKNGKN